VTGLVEDRDLVALYACAESFVYIPYEEGFGLALLEAMACGTPVVGADIEVMQEVCGEWATFALVRDPSGIAHAIDEACERWNTVLIEWGRSHARNLHLAGVCTGAHRTNRARVERAERWSGP
jgi:glycosyltransferase involved in cell wall biosynthesis